MTCNGGESCDIHDQVAETTLMSRGDNVRVDGSQAGVSRSGAPHWLSRFLTAARKRSGFFIPGRRCFGWGRSLSALLVVVSVCGRRVGS